jgi:hypothetical protein
LWFSSRYSLAEEGYEGTAALLTQIMGFHFIARYAPGAKRHLIAAARHRWQRARLADIGGHELLTGAALLSPPGGVLENGMPRFFRRFAQGVFDDLKFQTHELNEFVKRASEDYPIHKNRTIAVGYSNGANIAASLVLHVEAREIRSFPAA